MMVIAANIGIDMDVNDIPSAERPTCNVIIAFLTVMNELISIAVTTKIGPIDAAKRQNTIISVLVPEEVGANQRTIFVNTCTKVRIGPSATLKKDTDSSCKAEINAWKSPYKLSDICSCIAAAVPSAFSN